MSLEKDIAMKLLADKEFINKLMWKVATRLFLTIVTYAIILHIVVYAVFTVAIYILQQLTLAHYEAKRTTESILTTAEQLTIKDLEV